MTVVSQSESPRPDSPRQDSPVEITVVVCTYNRSRMLIDALESLLRQEIGDAFRWEILVVDNASTDDTPAAVAALAARVTTPLRHVVETRRGVVPARNRGVAEARGEWIAFFDDDQLADRRWLGELRDEAQRRKVLCVGGAVALALPEGCTRRLAKFARILLSETVGLDAPAHYDLKLTPGTGNVMIHRSVFEKVGGFDEAYHLRGEDTEFFRRVFFAGIEARYTPAAVIHHVITHDRLKDDYFLALARRMGVGLATLERSDYGPWLYPAMWLARTGQLYCLHYPQVWLAQWRGDSEDLLAARSRLEMQFAYFDGQPNRPASSPTTSPVVSPAVPPS